MWTRTEGWAVLLAESASILGGLLARLPPELIEDDAELAVVAAGNRLDFDDLAGADSYLGLVETRKSAVPGDRRARFAAGWALIRLYRARLAGDLDGIRATAGLQLFGLVNLGTAELWRGELEPAAGHLEEALALADTMTATVSEEFAQLDCLSQLALVEVARGRLRRAVERGQAAVTFAERRGWSRAMQAFGGHLALAWGRLPAGQPQWRRPAS